MPVARGLLEDQPGEAVPGEDIAAAIVIGPPSAEIRLGGLGQDRQNRAGKIGRRGVASGLVIDHLSSPRSAPQKRHCAAGSSPRQ